MSVANNNLNNPTRSVSPAPNYAQPQSPNERVVFPVIKNPQTQQKPIPYSQDPYQEPYDNMLAKQK